jgi:hypothetical protein
MMTFGFFWFLRIMPFGLMNASITLQWKTDWAAADLEAVFSYLGGMEVASKR